MKIIIKIGTQVIANKNELNQKSNLIIISYGTMNKTIEKKHLSKISLNYAKY